MKHSISTAFFVPLFAMTVFLAYGCGDDDNAVSPQQPGTAATTNPGPAPGSTPSPSPSPAQTVSIPQGAAGRGLQGYNPNPVTVAAGSTVTWINNDSVPHTVTADDGSFDSGAIQPGQSYSHTFPTEGTYSYYCTIHGRASMSGSVQVTPES